MEEENLLVVSVRAKLSRAGVKVARVLQACEDLDLNRDGLVHLDDLEAALSELLRGAEVVEDRSVNKREMRALMQELTDSRDKVGNKIEYARLLKVLQPREHVKRILKQEPERWHDDDDEAVGGGRGGSSRGRRHVSVAGGSGGDGAYWSQSRGSVGEWLANSACPAEIKNFKKLIAALENFERDSGVSILTARGGSLVVPLGPDLKATVSFSK